MKRMKRMIAAIISAATFITAFGSVSADAAMVKRFDGIIKTEFWMTSYHFKDDDAHHPDIQCQALYYSTGKVEVYFWNVRKYDESYDEEMTILLDDYEPVSTSSAAYQFKINGTKMVFDDDEVELTSGSLDGIDVNYYPKEYTYVYEMKPGDAKEYGFDIGGHGFGRGTADRQYFGYTVYPYFSDRGFYLQGFSAVTTLHNFGASLGMMRFSPKYADFTGEYNYSFRVMGHDLAVNNDLMNGYNHEPELRQQITELSEKVKAYETTISKQEKDISRLEDAYYKKDREATSLYNENVELTAANADLMDQVAVLKVKVKNLESGEQVKDPVYDINGDGYLTMSDIVLLCRIIAEAE